MELKTKKTHSFSDEWVFFAMVNKSSRFYLLYFQTYKHTTFEISFVETL
jgi:hypothetical protein